jgi:biopolymer transport protein ExbB
MIMSSKPSRVLLTLSLLVALSPLSRLGAQDISSNTTAAQAQLVQAQQELSKLRDEITAAKIPLSTALREAETELFAKRREAERLQRLADNRNVDLRNLENEQKLRAEEVDYLSTLLTDYLSRLNSTVDASEIQIVGESLTKMLNVGETPDIAREQIFKTKLGSIDMGFDRIKNLLGGAKFDGKAILPGGSLQDGTFMLLGPLSYFASKDGKVAGLVERGAAMHPKVTVFNEKEIPAIAALATKGEGPLSIDTTMGKAKAIATSKESISEHIKKGGMWMIPIIGFGIAAVCMALFKFGEISTVKALPADVLEKVLALVSQGNIPEAAKMIRTHPGPAAKMLSEAVKNLHLPKEVVEEMMFETMLETQPKLERGLSFISVTASVAPLLGLLGTVTGMMTTFNLITLFGTGDAKSLSSGISEALITTEYGLIVAIPALLLYGYLSRRVNGMMGDLEQISIAFSNGVSAIRTPATEPTLNPENGKSSPPLGSGLPSPA